MSGDAENTRCTGRERALRELDLDSGRDRAGAGVDGARRRRVCPRTNAACRFWPARRWPLTISPPFFDRNGRRFANCVLWLPALAAYCVVVRTRIGDELRFGSQRRSQRALRLAIGLGAIPALRTYQFTVWIVAAVVAALLYPSSFLHIGPIDLPFGSRPRNRPARQADHAGHHAARDVRHGHADEPARLRRAGTHDATASSSAWSCSSRSCRWSDTAWRSAFGFPPEIAAGIVLIGSCSSGLASNVMTYLAKANLTLSVTLTAIGTLTAPLTTPLWMKLLAGRMVPVDFVGMMLDIIKLVIVPIGAALLHDYLKHASRRGRRVVLVARGGWRRVARSAGARRLGVAASTHLSGNALAAFGLSASCGVRWSPASCFTCSCGGFPRSKHKMPIASMFGIIFFTAVTTAAGRDALLVMGWLLLIVSILHNLIGLMLGYWLSRAVRARRNVGAHGRARSRLSKRRDGLGAGRQNGNARHASASRRPCSARGRISPARSWPTTGDDDRRPRRCDERLAETDSRTTRPRTNLCKFAATAILVLRRRIEAVEKVFDVRVAVAVEVAGRVGGIVRDRGRACVSQSSGMPSLSASAYGSPRYSG